MSTLSLRPTVMQQALRHLKPLKPKGSPGPSPKQARQRRRLRAREFCDLLARQYPPLFPPFNAPLRAPLATSIHRSLRARHPEVSWPTLRSVLRQHTSAPADLSLLIARTRRLDFDGRPVGILSQGEAEHAAERLLQLSLRADAAASRRSRMSAPADLRDLRFRRDIERLHRLGARAIYELLSALGARHLLRTEIEQTVARYGRIDPATVQLAAGDRMPPTPLYQLPGGERQ
jgi:ProQ/FINO family